MSNRRLDIFSRPEVQCTGGLLFLLALLTFLWCCFLVGALPLSPSSPSLSSYLLACSLTTAITTICQHYYLPSPLPANTTICYLPTLLPATTEISQHYYLPTLLTLSAKFAVRAGRQRGACSCVYRHGCSCVYGHVCSHVYRQGCSRHVGRPKMCTCAFVWTRE